MALQHTIGNAVSLSGTGLHTGAPAQVTLKPAPEHSGIRFVRTDLSPEVEIVADIDNVVDLSRGTAIGKESTRVYSVEHLMSAFAGMEIDNCRVEVNAQEIPLMDGSALPYVELIRQSGIVEQTAQREFLKIDEPMMTYLKDDVAFGIFPSDHFRVTLMIDYKHPSLGTQHTTLIALKDYEKEFAPARTFCFLSEIEKLREAGLIKGGSFDNAVVVQDVELTSEHIAYMRSLFNWQGPITRGENGFVNNTQLRYFNELCRHKVVDLLGDFYLLGKPLQAFIQTAKTGHASNIEMARKVREHFRNRKIKAVVEEPPALNHEQILKTLPHRYPFLLIDRVLKIEPRKSITAIKNVSFNEPYFNGHFPGEPVMPGVLQIEAMAQAGGIMGMYGQKKEEDQSIAFLAIDNARFRGAVRPGDVLRIEVEMLKDRRATIRFAGKCFVGTKLVSEAEMMAMIMKKGQEG